MQKLKILIADDHPIMRHGLRQIIDAEPDMCVTSEASDGKEVIGLIANNHYDVLVLDISMPGLNGIEVLRHIREAKLRLPVLILTILPEDRYAMRIMASGASGYMTKDSAPDLLITAIRKIVRGERYLSETAVNLLVDVIASPGEQRHEMLSEREMYVLMKIAKGASIKEIASELHLSSKTVSTYRARILLKLGLKTTSDLIRYALDNGIVDV